ncbi:hypothetical protein PAXRUDRAFT_592652 [Paxillus rubicundulus Ve08.2h10]|uniref:Uncharacterized protein n=1 Tax=Paxillus rubicundulus Ve08.2h10 TaxID=930991 RepID=A0A0D0DVR1_9AGAM|nr:hypothetical protein PAXRUDRAFT_592652 [Paxillus rubicundulus Ve08.2h10]
MEGHHVLIPRRGLAMLASCLTDRGVRSQVHLDAAPVRRRRHMYINTTATLQELLVGIHLQQQKQKQKQKQKRMETNQIAGMMMRLMYRWNMYTIKGSLEHV